MLTSGRLQELASAARVARVVQYPVVRVVAHLFGMVECGNVCCAVSRRTQAEKEVRLWQQGAYSELMVPL
jgi:hypothetical protein